MVPESVPPEQTVAEMREGIDETKGHLGDQMAALGNEVMDVMHDATAAVSETIEGVEKTVGDTVTSMKSAFDLPGHVGRHPWLLLGVAVALGYVCGRYLLPRR